MVLYAAVEYKLLNAEATPLGNDTAHQWTLTLLIGDTDCLCKYHE